ncbi:MAG: Rrf2 family transcriptional regulator [Aggregatilineales bacterium]
MSNTRYTVAVHIMTALDHFYIVLERPTTSDELAWSVNTNPVLIRRIIGQLKRAGLVTSQAGAKGGFLLAHPPEDITLLDIYNAMQTPVLFPMHSSNPNPDCDVGANIQDVLGIVYENAEDALKIVLSQTTIADLHGDILAHHTAKTLD